MYTKGPHDIFPTRSEPADIYATYSAKHLGEINLNLNSISHRYMAYVYSGSSEGAFPGLFKKVVLKLCFGDTRQHMETLFLICRTRAMC